MNDETDARSSLRAEIEQDGWSVRCAQMAQGGFPSAYTVGLSRFALPEIITFGLADPGEATQLLDRVAKRALEMLRTDQAMLPLISGTVLCDLFDGGFPAALIDVDSPAENLPIANMLFGEYGNLRAVQLVLPDENLRWPWHPESTLYRDLPVLGTPPAHLSN